MNDSRGEIFGWVISSLLHTDGDIAPELSRELDPAASGAHRRYQRVVAMPSVAKPRADPAALLKQVW